MFIGYTMIQLWDTLFIHRLSVSMFHNNIKSRNTCFNVTTAFYFNVYIYIRAGIHDRYICIRVCEYLCVFVCVCMYVYVSICIVFSIFSSRQTLFKVYNIAIMFVLSSDYSKYILLSFKKGTLNI